jgi:hypothetical protein
MVTLAQSSPGDRSARAPQSKTATVMLVREGKYAAEVSIELIEEEGGWSPYL